MPSSSAVATAASSTASDPYHHLVPNTIQDRILMLQMAQRNHTLAKPPINGIAIILPEPLQSYYHDNNDDEDDEDNSMTPSMQSEYLANFTSDRPHAGTKKLSVLCILPQWPGRFFCKRKRGVSTAKSAPADTSTVRLLGEGSSQGEWS